MNSNLNELYGKMYDMLISEDYEGVNNYINEFINNSEVNKNETLLYVGLARITKPHRDKLKNREVLLNITKERLKKECSEMEAENVYSSIE